MSNVSNRVVDLAIQHIYDCVNSPHSWEAAIDMVVNTTQAVSGIIAVSELDTTIDKLGSPYELSIVSSELRLKEKELAEYFEKYHAYEKAEMDVLLTCEKHKIFPDSYVYGDTGLPTERDDFRHRAEKFGIHRRLAVRLDDNQRWAEFLLLQFGDQQDPMRLSTLNSLERLIPHVAKAVELGRTFGELYRRYHAVLGALDKITIGLCLMQADGQVVLNNECANEIFDSSPLVNLSKERHLVFKDPLIDVQIASAINATASAARGASHVQEVLCVSSDDLLEHKLLIEVAPIRDSLTEIGSAEGYAMVSLIDPSIEHAVATERLGMIYRLSPSEMAVCKFLVEGNTYSEIAEKRGVGVETVKTQVRSISEKTSTPSRVGLVRLALKLSPPLAI